MTSPEHAEGQLRHALRVRAEDMAAGDGVPWDATRDRPGSLPFARTDSGRRFPSWRTVAAAVAALALPIGVGAMLLADAGAEPTSAPSNIPPCPSVTTTTTTVEAPGPTTTTTAPGDPGFATSTTTTVPTGDPGFVTTTTTVPTGDPGFVTTTTTLPGDPGFATSTTTTTEPQQPGSAIQAMAFHLEDNEPTTTEPCEATSQAGTSSDAWCANVLPVGEIVDYAFRDDDPLTDDDAVRIGASPVSDLPPDGQVGLTPEPVTAGPYRASLWSSDETDLIAVDVMFGEVVVSAQGMNHAEDMIAILASVMEQEDGSFTLQLPCEAEEIARGPVVSNGG